MSRSQTDSVAHDPTSDRKKRLHLEIWGLLLITTGLILFLALISFSRTDIHRQGEVFNLIGPVGVQIANFALRSVGLGAFFLDAVLFFCGFSLFFRRSLRPNVMEGVGYFLALPAGTVTLHLLFKGERVLGHKAGGFLGELGCEIGRSLVGNAGTIILTGMAMVLSATLITQTNPSTLGVRLIRWLLTWGRRLVVGGVRRVGAACRWMGRHARWPSWLRIPGRRGKEPFQQEDQFEDLDEPIDLDEEFLAELPRTDTAPPPKALPLERLIRHPPPPPQKKKPVRPADAQIEISLAPSEPGVFMLPSSSLLAPADTSPLRVDQYRLVTIGRQLEQAFKEFKIDGKVTGITPGPVVTMYEYEPAAGVKLSSISNLSNDLARVIKAQSVRIVAPIPGKGVVGLEVPNEFRATVYLRELIEDEAFTGCRARLPLAIGKDITGKPVIADLSKMPHLLVAGATGSGKSVAINAMVTSLLYQASPAEVRLILVDPKMLELNIYEGIPHLLVPVVTDPKKAAVALRWAVDEMERRYACLSALKVRNIAGYNKEVERLLGLPPKELPIDLEVDIEGRPILEPLPHVVIVIDEFADLMMVASKDVEMCVARLAQKARAAGVHLILATQRPSVDVITGLIKANFPTRISFRVFSRVDSRTILDTQGAENLLGMGDMLFRPPGRGDLVRVHGAYVDEKEILKVVEHLKAQGQPDYRHDILNEVDAEALDLDSDLVDEMYDQAVQLVTSERKASISMVQRKLRVGYNRAARMIEMMEREGIVGPSDARGGREVIASPAP
ncbi:MAG: DNA translocase FtsK 4TM domain-containing protein [Bradymonadales bacterium]|nr:DNA translocase FtsK 4TM domain-containing protein [Bradymonadales bacterium]